MFFQTGAKTIGLKLRSDQQFRWRVIRDALTVCCDGARRYQVEVSGIAQTPIRAVPDYRPGRVDAVPRDVTTTCYLEWKFGLDFVIATLGVQYRLVKGLCRNPYKSEPKRFHLNMYTFFLELPLRYVKE